MEIWLLSTDFQMSIEQKLLLNNRKSFLRQLLRCYELRWRGILRVTFLSLGDHCVTRKWMWGRGNDAIQCNAQLPHFKIACLLLTWPCYKEKEDVKIWNESAIQSMTVVGSKNRPLSPLPPHWGSAGTPTNHLFLIVLLSTSCWENRGAKGVNCTK